MRGGTIPTIALAIGATMNSAAIYRATPQANASAIDACSSNLSKRN
ncbi:hypothetical protein H7K14_16010 [Mycolicibacter longobardus]|nr:hypothetical protein [Mycolicibacter longobardus]